jgi:hypothetical protein
MPVCSPSDCTFRFAVRLLITAQTELMKKGITFRSQTDTEVIANMIGSYLDEGKSLMDAVRTHTRTHDAAFARSQPQRSARQMPPPPRRCITQCFCVFPPSRR